MARSDPNFGTIPQYIAVLGFGKMEEIGKQIAERRKKKGLSQQDLAEKSGSSPRTINAVEQGKANPSINVLCKMVKPLGFVVTLCERVKHE